MVMGLPDYRPFMSGCLVSGASTVCHEGKRVLWPRLPLFDRQPPLSRMSWKVTHSIAPRIALEKLVGGG